MPGSTPRSKKQSTPARRSIIEEIAASTSTASSCNSPTVKGTKRPAHVALERLITSTPKRRKRDTPEKQALERIAAEISL